MRLGYPYLLALALAGVVLLGAYLWWLRRGRRSTTTFSAIGLVRTAAEGQQPWRRHVPVVLVCVALVFLGTGAARPLASLTVPSDDATVILAIDVSGSMCNTDVTPNRLGAAQAAVRKFVEAQKGIEIGLVVFSGSAQLAVAPTRDTAELLKAVDGLTVGRSTAIGAAILTAVDAIAAIDPAVGPTEPADTTTPAPTDVVPADPVPEVVVLLTDGANTRGVTPQVAAVQAAERGVRVYTVGFGTKNPTTMACSSSQISGGSYGGGGFGGPGGGRGGFGGGQALIADDDTLKTVARITGGEFFSAQTADQLNDVLAGVKSRLGTTKEDVDLSAGFAILGSLLLLAGALVTLRRNPLG